MPKKFSAEQIVTRLRQVEFLLAQNKMIAVACKEMRMTDKPGSHKWSSKSGAIPNVSTHRFVTNHLRHTSSHQNPFLSARRQTCNNVSTSLLQNIEQAISIEEKEE